MFETLDIQRIARDLASHSAGRMSLVAANVANADTPGFRAKDLPSFAEVFAADGAMRGSRPGHMGSGTSPGAEAVDVPSAGHQSPNGNSVSLEAEMIRAASIRQDHDMALAVQRSVTAILRTALGRGA